MRERWIDFWKGQLIFLVVLGHVAGAMAHMTSGSANASMALMYKWIYCFHMPAFFFLYGYVRALRADGTPPFQTFLKKKVRRLVVPYFFWGIVSFVAFSVLGGLYVRFMSGVDDGYYKTAMMSDDILKSILSFLHAGGWPQGEGFRSNSVLWFLPSMFTTSIAYEMLLRCFTANGRTKIWDLGVLALIAFAIGGVMRLYVRLALPWGMSSLPWWLAFMSIGGVVAESGVVRRTSPATRFVFLALGVILFTTVVAALPNMIWAYLRWGGYLTAAAMGIAGCLLSLAAASLYDGFVDERGLKQRLGGIWIGFGLSSMGIMLVHKFPVCGMQLMAMRLKLLDGLGSGVLAFVLAIAAAVGVIAVSHFAAVAICAKFPAVFGESGKRGAAE